MSLESIHQYEVVFAAAGVEPGLLRPTRIVAHEELSAPYTIDVELSFERGDVDAPALLRTAAQLVVHHGGDGTVVRRFSGIITRVRERAKREKGKQKLGVTIESPLHLLTLFRDYKIFQERTTKEIVDSVLEACGVDAASVKWRLAGSYPKREVCTQFGESALQFVSRILEEDGIFYFFELAEDGPKLVFGDTDTAYARTAPAPIVSFRDETGMLAEEAVTEIVEMERVRPAKVTLRDHDFKKPTLDLEVKAQKDAPHAREHYDYPGRYVAPAEGKRRAQLRLDAMIAASTGALGRSHVYGLTAGHWFALTGAPSATFDKEWVVRAIDHCWDDAGEDGAMTYFNTFHLLAKSLPFRPLARAPRAIVPGPQTAEVAGPAGEEIHTDEYGRVKVVFPWDRHASGDEKSSCWIRVGQLHSSGSVVIPRIGWEVLVEFEDGDPDKPLIVGRLFNGKFTPPYPLPAKKTMTAMSSHVTPGGGGHNEIRMDDGAGAEQINVVAHKDLNVVVGNDKDELVTTSQNVGVKVDQTLKVGASQTVSIGAASNVIVAGAQKWTVGAARSKTIAGDEKVTIKGSRTTSIGASHTVMTPMTDSVSSKGAFAETIGGSCMEMAALGVSAAVAGSASITVGAVKLEAVATGKSETVIGARASTVGGAFINASGKDIAFGVKGVKATTVGGAWIANAGAGATLSAKTAVNITVGGAAILTAASKMVLKVGGSTVTLSAGRVVLDADEIKITGSGPVAELAGMSQSK